MAQSRNQKKNKKNNFGFIYFPCFDNSRDFLSCIKTKIKQIIATQETENALTHTKINEKVQLFCAKLAQKKN